MTNAEKSLKNKALIYGYSNERNEMITVRIPLSMETYFEQIDKRDAKQSGKNILKGRIKNGCKSATKMLLFDRYPDDKELLEEMLVAVVMHLERKSLRFGTAKEYVKAMRYFLELINKPKSFKKMSIDEFVSLREEIFEKKDLKSKRILELCIEMHKPMISKNIDTLPRLKFPIQSISNLRDLHLDQVKKLNKALETRLDEIIQDYENYKIWDKELEEKPYFSKENIAKIYCKNNFKNKQMAKNFFSRIFNFEGYSIQELMKLAEDGVDIFSFEDECSVYKFMKTLMQKGVFLGKIPAIEVCRKPINSYFSGGGKDSFYKYLEKKNSKATSFFIKIRKHLLPQTEIVIPFLTYLCLNLGHNPEVLCSIERFVTRKNGEIINAEENIEKDSISLYGYKAKGTKQFISVFIKNNENNKILTYFNYLIEILKPLRELQDKTDFNSNLLFFGYAGNKKIKKMSSSDITEFLRKFIDECDIRVSKDRPLKITARDFRKFFLTAQKLAGARPEQIQACATHKSVFTQKNYLAFTNIKEIDDYSIAMLQNKMIESAFLNSKANAELKQESDTILFPISSLLLDKRVVVEKKHLPFLQGLFNYASFSDTPYYQNICLVIEAFFNSFDLSEKEREEIDLIASSQLNFFHLIESNFIINKNDLKMEDTYEAL